MSKTVFFINFAHYLLKGIRFHEKSNRTLPLGKHGFRCGFLPHVFHIRLERMDRLYARYGHAIQSD